MKEAKEISIEEWSIENDTLMVDYYEHNDLKEFHCPIDHLEHYVKENDLLEWSDIVMVNNEAVDSKEGVWEFSEYVKERLDSHTVKRFLISELEKMKAT